MLKAEQYLNVEFFKYLTTLKKTSYTYCTVIHILRIDFLTKWCIFIFRKADTIINLINEKFLLTKMSKNKNLNFCKK